MSGVTWREPTDPSDGKPTLGSDLTTDHEVKIEGVWKRMVQGGSSTWPELWADGYRLDNLPAHAYVIARLAPKPDPIKERAEKGEVDDERPLHPWSGDDEGHGCASCGAESLWKCDPKAHPVSLKAAVHHIITRIPPKRWDASDVAELIVATAHTFQGIANGEADLPRKPTRYNGRTFDDWARRWDAMWEKLDDDTGDSEYLNKLWAEYMGADLLVPEKPTEKQIKTIIDEEFQAVRDPKSQATTMDRIAARVAALYGPVPKKPSDEERIERLTKEIHYWTRTDSDEMAARHAASNIVEEGL